ncbi:hypothetical protein D3C87_2064030 [compost metagenome]
MIGLRQTLTSLNHVFLQAACKKYGLPANKKSKEMIEQLEGKYGEMKSQDTEPSESEIPSFSDIFLPLDDFE